MKTHGVFFGIVLAVTGVLLLPLAVGQRLTVTESAHNLSPSGPGPVRATRGYACLFCHAPHNANAGSTPLWNRQLAAQSYELYTSTTYHQIGVQLQIGSPSKLCLSCHDGTIALGQTLSEGLIPVTGALSAAANFGTNLSRSHPFSFATPFVDNGELRTSLFGSPPVTGDPLVKLVQERVECTTCHDPHTPNLDPVVGKFLVRDSANGRLCLACHDPSRSTANYLRGWPTSQHALASHSTGGNPALGSYPTVAASACVSCHEPHNSLGGRLLRQNEEASCAACHGGQNLSPALPNVIAAFSASQYKHPIDLTGLHEPAESTFPLNSSRHAECPDCHNPHASRGGGVASLPPAVQLSLSGAAGVSATDGQTPLKPASNEFEVCFKCHANSTNKPQSSVYLAYGRTPFRRSFSTVPDPYNVRLEFQSQVARHNITQPARTALSQSLRTSMLTLSGSTGGRSLAVGTYLYCTDCHNNDGARTSGGGAADGPHGSKHPHLLERQYEMEPVPVRPGDSSPGITFVSGFQGTAALCDKCHDISGKILIGDPVFKQHDTHVRGAGASCSTCHAPHGIQGGILTNNGHLLDFDQSIVGPSSSGLLYIDTAGRACYLRCHGQDHNPLNY